jgi:hypothetical protein
LEQQFLWSVNYHLQKQNSKPCRRHCKTMPALLTLMHLNGLWFGSDLCLTLSGLKLHAKEALIAVFANRGEADQITSCRTGKRTLSGTLSLLITATKRAVLLLTSIFCCFGACVRQYDTAAERHRPRWAASVHSAAGSRVCQHQGGPGAAQGGAVAKTVHSLHYRLRPNAGSVS